MSQFSDWERDYGSPYDHAARKRTTEAAPDGVWGPDALLRWLVSDLVPEEAIEKATDLTYRGWQLTPAHAKHVLEYAAPLILAAWIEQLADNYAAAAEIFGKRSESLLSERAEGFQGSADRAVGKAIILEQEAVTLRRQASVLRWEGDRDG